MKHLIIILILSAGFITSYSYAERGGHMMGSGMMGSPGYGKETRGYGQSMMGHGGYGMMGSGGCGMMGPGMMGHHQMMHGMMGPGMMQGYDAEEYQKYLDDTAELRKKLHGKKFEYSEALRKVETKPETMKRIQKEMWEIQKALTDRWYK